MEITGNTKKNLTQIIDESDEANQRGTISSSIQHNAELNEIIRDLNVIRGRKGKTLFDKNNMIIKLTAQQLDKFSNHKKMPNLTVEINYSLQWKRVVIYVFNIVLTIKIIYYFYVNIHC